MPACLGFYICFVSTKKNVTAQGKLEIFPLENVEQPRRPMILAEPSSGICLQRKAWIPKTDGDAEHTGELFGLAWLRSGRFYPAIRSRPLHPGQNGRNSVEFINRLEHESCR